MADIKISQLGEALAVTDNDILPMTASGVTSKVKVSTMKRYMVDDLDVSDLNDTTITSVANEDGLVYNSTSQKWENKQIVQKNQISNPNLLDNPWFTVNQRGSSTYSGNGYTADRWARGAGDVSGHTLTLGDATGTQVTLTEVKGDLYQPLNSHTTYLLSRPYTISAYIDGVLYQHTFTPIADGQTHQIMPNIGVDNLQWNIIENWNADAHLVGINNFASTTDHYITKIKLELGTFSTLYMDNTPNYAEELLKCQRYYWRGHYAQYATVAEFDSGASWTEIFIGVNAMRATPALTINGSIDYVAVGGETPWVAYSDLRVQENAGGYVLGGNRGVSGSPTAGYCFSTDADGTTIELSADL